jgi:hypothetical protein
MIGLMIWWCATSSEEYSKVLILVKLKKKFKRKIELCHCLELLDGIKASLYVGSTYIWTCCYYHITERLCLPSSKLLMCQNSLFFCVIFLRFKISPDLKFFSSFATGSKT